MDENTTTPGAVHLWETRQAYAPWRSDPMCPFDNAPLQLRPINPGSGDDYVCPDCGNTWNTAGQYLRIVDIEVREDHRRRGARPFTARSGRLCPGQVARRLIS